MDTDYATEDLSPLSTEQLEEMLGYREAAETDAEAFPEEELALESTALDKPWQDVISRRGYDFCVRWETGGKAYYERIIKGKPAWPGYSSGITIGCGYDLGYHKLAQFEADWGHRIPKAAFDRLARTIGFRTVEPGRAAKVTRARQLIRSLSDIVIAWDIAIEQFNMSKMPKLVRQLYSRLDNLDRLHPHCRGALLSLTFNRGGGIYSLSGNRYTEGREIARLMRSGTAADFRKIPAQFRSMKRIWGSASSLSKRRDEEADLFELGLREESLFESVASLSPTGQLESIENQPVEVHDDVEEQTDLGDEAPDEDIWAESLEAVGQSQNDVRWNPNDDEQPDYRHLPKPASVQPFDLIADDIEALVSFNDFAVKDGLLIFALRGARLLGADKREKVASITVESIRPDHREYRCVMGVLNRKTRHLWAYRASTVPSSRSVLNCYRLHQQGKPLDGNILPTGCYTYTVGTHRAGQSSEIRGVLRLSRTSSGASRTVVLRSLNDVMYDRHDFWHTTAPADNIHPGRHENRFSSAGCLTLPGNYTKSSQIHSGLWADFREALGMKAKYQTSDDGRQFSCVLLTGLDAALASNLRKSGEISDTAKSDAALRRLRFGSQGDRVAELQDMLGLAKDPLKLIGPVTRSTLIRHQQQKFGWADGIWTPGNGSA